MSQWPKWLRRQYGKLEICGSSPGYDTNFSLKNYQKNLCLRWDLNIRSVFAGIALFKIVDACITFWQSWVEIWEEGLILSWYLCLSGSVVEHQCIKLEIWGSNPSLDTHFSEMTEAFTWSLLSNSGLDYRGLSLCSLANTPTATTPENVSYRWGRNIEGKESWEWKTPGLRRRRHRQSGFQHTDRPRPSTPELLNKDHTFLSHYLSYIQSTDMQNCNIIAL